MASDFMSIWDHTYSFIDGTVQVKIHEDLDAGLGGTLFDGSVALTEYLESLYRNKGKSHFERHSWVELGAGCGFPGLLVGKLGGRVVLTDVPGVAVDLLNENIELNVLEDTVSAQALDWNSQSDLDAFAGRKFDFILAADTIYSVDAVDGFLKSCLALSHAGTEVLFAHPRARVKEASAVFWKEVGTYFSVEKVEARHFVKGWTPETKQFLHPEQGVFVLRVL